MTTIGNDGSNHPPTPSHTQLKIREADALRPVTLRQVLNADHYAPSSNLYMINGRKFQSIKVVATIREEIVRERYISYKLDDGTIDSARPVYAMFFPNNSYEYDPLMPQCTGGLPCLRDISLVGRIDRFKTGDGTRFIRIESLHPVTDPHETFHHVLEVMTTELMYTRGLPPAMQAASARQHACQPTVTQSSEEHYEEPEGNEDEDEIARHDHPTNTPAPQRIQRPSRHAPLAGQAVSAPHTPTRPSTSRRPLSPLVPELQFLSLNSPPSTPQASSSRSAVSTTASSTGRNPISNRNAAARPSVTPVASTSKVPASTPQASSRRSAVSTSTPFTGRRPASGENAAARPTVTPVVSPSRVPDARRATTANLPASQRATPANTSSGPRLSMRDPLSHLSSLQRSILLKIMDDVAAGISEDVYVTDIVQHIKQIRSENVTFPAIRDALEFLVEADLIEPTTDEFDYFKAKDSKGKRRAYDLPID